LEIISTSKKESTWKRLAGNVVRNIFENNKTINASNLSKLEEQYKLDDI